MIGMLEGQQKANYIYKAPSALKNLHEVTIISSVSSTMGYSVPSVSKMIISNDVDQSVVVFQVGYDLCHSLYLSPLYSHHHKAALS